MAHSTNELYENLRLELRRGSLIIAVLAALRSEQYGYTLRKTLSDCGIDIDEGTLYPLLRRLETQGLLLSEWREAGASLRRRQAMRLARLSAQDRGRKPSPSRGEGN